MTVGERRNLITRLIAQALSKVMSDDFEAVRIGAFEKTGCLITHIPLDVHDNKIKPQGMEVGTYSIPKNRTFLNSQEATQVDGRVVTTPTPVTEEECALRDERNMIQEDREEEGDEEDLVLRRIRCCFFWGK